MTALKPNKRCRAYAQATQVAFYSKAKTTANFYWLQRNQDAYNYVLTAVNEIAGSAPAGLVEVVAMETLNATFPVYTSVWSVQGSNILVRVKGIAPDSTRCVHIALAFKCIQGT
jgi:hypothetical protein